MVLVLHNHDAGLAPDERGYMRRANVVAADLTQDRATFRPPLYPYAVALLYNTLGAPRFIANTFQALLDTLSVGMMYALALALLARRSVALLAAFLFAIFPQAIGFTGAL